MTRPVPTPQTISRLAATVVESAAACGVMIVTVESCTGGLVSSAITSIAGSSAVFERGFVTYSNKAKIDMVDVPLALLDRHGAVSTEVARAMAEGALPRSNATLSVSITGIAGPGGGSAEKPVGLVYFACAKAGEETRFLMRTYGDLGRDTIRLLATEDALTLLLERLTTLTA